MKHKSKEEFLKQICQQYSVIHSRLDKCHKGFFATSRNISKKKGFDAVKVIVKVDVEYCGKCNFEWQCKMLQNFLQEKKPDTDMICHKGRQGSFKVRVNCTLVHSKLQSLAFPDHESVLEYVKRAEQGLPMEKAKEQPIDNCLLM